MKEKVEPVPVEKFKTTFYHSQEYISMQKKIEEQNKTIKELKRENTQLKKILENGEMNRLEEMVSEFQREVKKSLKDISDEVSVTDFSSRTIDSVNNLIDFLSYMSKELYSLVSISNEGYFAYSEELRRCEKLKEDLLLILGKSSFTNSILPDKAEEMVNVLKKATSDIVDCMKEDD